MWQEMETRRDSHGREYQVATDVCATVCPEGALLLERDAITAMWRCDRLGVPCGDWTALPERWLQVHEIVSSLWRAA